MTLRRTFAANTFLRRSYQNKTEDGSYDSSATGACTATLFITPTTTLVNNVPNLTKLKAVQVSQGQAATLVWTLLDPNSGCAINLSDCSTATIHLVIREALSIDPNINAGVTITGSITDLSNGVVQATLTNDVVACPGISIAEWQVLSPSGSLIFSNYYYLVVNRSLFGAANQCSCSGLPSLAEIRLHLRDSAPADNLWLASYEWDMAEIAACIERPILLINEMPPPLNIRFNTSNFNYRYYWLEGIIAGLYQMASYHYLRTHLPVSAAGVTVDDKAKYREYATIAEQKWQSYKEWARWLKIRLNAEQAYQSSGSAYDSYYYWPRNW